MEEAPIESAEVSNDLVQQAYDFTQPVIDSLTTFWQEVVGFVPNLIGALVFLLVGKLIAKWVSYAVEKLLKALKIEDLSKRIGLTEAMKSVGLKSKVSAVFGVLVYWIIYLVFILAAVEALGVEAITGIVEDLIAYLPNVIAALFTMIIGIAVANFAEKAVQQFHYGKVLGKLTYFAIIVLVIVSALEQIGIAISFFTNNVEILMMGIALAFGLAFGLGGKHRAEDFIDHFLDKKRKK